MGKNQGVSKIDFFSGGCKGRLFLSLFQPLEVAMCSLARGPPLSSKQMIKTLTSASMMTSASLTLTLLFLFYKDAYDYIGPTWIIYNALPSRDP